MTNIKKDILAVLAIIILLLLIILPPVLRKFYPKNQTTTKISPNITLTCTKKAIDNFNIKITTKYKDSKVNKIDLVFENNSKYHNEYNEGVVVSSESRVLLKYYASLIGSYYWIVDNKSYVTLSEETKTSYPKDDIITHMFSSYEKTKKYYENNDYTCK